MEEQLKPEELTPEQILDLAKWAHYLNEENKQLRAHLYKLEAQFKSLLNSHQNTEFKLNRLESLEIQEAKL